MTQSEFIQRSSRIVSPTMRNLQEATILAATSFVLVIFASGQYLLSLFVSFSASITLVLLRRYGLGPVLLALNIMVLPPSFLAENIEVALVSSLTFFVMSFLLSLRHRDYSVGMLSYIVPLALSVLAIVGAFVVSGLVSSSTVDLMVRFITAGSWALCAISVYRLSFCVALTSDMMRVLILIVCTMSVSYLLTCLMKFSQFNVPHVDFITSGRRDVVASFPVTITGGRGGFLEAFPRMLLSGGEGGINILLVLPLFIVSCALYRGSKRVVVVSLLSVPLVFGQASTTIIACGVGLVAGLVQKFFRTNRFVEFLAVLAVGIAGASAFGFYLVGLKFTANAGSLSDRGLSSTGLGLGGLDSSVGEINLLVTAYRNPILAFALALLLLVLLRISWGSPVLVGSAIVMLITACVGQPTQWQVGGYALLVIAMAIYRRLSILRLGSRDEVTKDNGAALMPPTRERTVRAQDPC